ncbi:IS4 family transposase [Paraburkholderia madseniana]|jgi:Insertion element 4 transposase N-terminal/Transposase DDE domain|uniref:IS4 family transposase n=1 Tax=Paraburkholderia madseniana TaxID=2599607 RepID=A0A6N6W190_9BURK|nr:IS4 family transposase [Paraburkholderia madseniana]KAE8753340.1 IS4 family transposase [Paraburkholderia madseniana]NPT70923.1 IS4 family transposase [Paraburkholderia madseniana]
MLSAHLTYLIEAQEPVADLSRLAEHLPYEWIEHAVRATGTASLRRRRLPSEQVVWLVIALAMYRHWSISEVLDGLDLALPSEDAPFVSKSAVTQARQRIGEAPLAWLFDRTARAWTRQDAAHHAFKGLSLWAMDGTTLRTPDSPANREHFGAQGYASGRVASYPQVRAVTLTAIPTHLVADINFGRYDTNEMVYAKGLLPQIPEDSLTVFDKGFLSAEILCGLTMGGRNRHFLIPAKSNSCWEVIAGTADDATVRMRVSPQARKKCPALPEFWNARAIRTIDARGRERVLLTSLGDRRRFKPADILACYERRWQIETSYRELKQSMLGSELTLRSRTVEGVYQEIWGALIAYNLIRREIASAAWEAKLEPTDISFVRALHTIQHEMMWAALTPAYAKLPACLKRLRERLKSLPNEKRPGRACDRVVKSRPHRYTVRFLKKDLN